MREIYSRVDGSRGSIIALNAKKGGANEGCEVVSGLQGTVGSKISFRLLPRM